MRFRKQAVGILAIVAVGFAVPAAAQQTPATTEYPECKRTPTAAESDEAHKKYIAGKSSYDTGKYDIAITRFREAYAKDCTKHELLVILSRAYEFNHDLPEAIHALETYLDRVADAPDRQTYKDRITSLKQKLGPPPSASASTPPPPASATAPPPPPPPPPQESPPKHSVYPLLLGATGGVALTVGILLEVLKPALPYNCDVDTGECDFRANFDDTPQHKRLDQKKVTTTTATVIQQQDLKRDQDKASTEESLKTAGIICIVGGAALLVGAAVWFFVEPTISSSDKDKSQRFITPQVGPGYGGLSFGGSF